MPRVDDNADIYAAKRLNIFFPGVIPSLDGQCVSLVKWFMAEMSEVPNPQAARGDARYVGQTLVRQGHAVEVPYAQRRRGDIITYENGVYGHIGVVLSGDRTFEENVNWPGVSSKIVDGARVYASRVGNLSEAWRKNQHIYRLKSYNEKGDDIVKPTEADVYYAFRRYALKEPDNPEQVQFYMNRDIRDLYFDLLNFEVVPKVPEVQEAFKEFQPWTPIDTPPYTDQTAYYSSRAEGALYRDLCVGLKKKLDESGSDSNYKEAGTIDGSPVYRKVKQFYGRSNIVYPTNHYRGNADD